MINNIFILRDDANTANVRRGLYNFLQTLDVSSPKQVQITDYREKKTDEQRSGFHLLCGILGKELGYSQADIKEYAKIEVLGVKTVNIGGTTREVVKSSEKAKRIDYSALIEGVYRLASQAGVVLPILMRKD